VGERSCQIAAGATITSPHRSTCVSSFAACDAGGVGLALPLDRLELAQSADDLLDVRRHGATRAVEPAASRSTIQPANQRQQQAQALEIFGALLGPSARGCWSTAAAGVWVANS
jgi:hypothetical protein